MIKLRESMERWIRVDFRAKKRKGEEKRREERKESKKESCLLYTFIGIENKYFFFDHQGIIGWIGVFARVYFARGGGKKKEEKKKGKLFVESRILSWNDQSFKGNGGGKKVFSIESRQLHRCSRHRY